MLMFCFYKRCSAFSDVVVLTGDLTDGKAEILRNAAQPLSEIQAKYGKFFVTGQIICIPSHVYIVCFFIINYKMKLSVCMFVCTQISREIPHVQRTAVKQTPKIR